MVNEKNAKKVYKFLKKHPKVHAQSEWVTLDGEMPEPSKDAIKAIEKKVEKNFCGTTMCAAGAAVWVVEGKKEFRRTVKDFFENGSDDHAWTDRGAEILGISTDRAHNLFYNMNEEVALAQLKALSKGDLDEFDRLTDEDADY